MPQVVQRGTSVQSLLALVAADFEALLEVLDPDVVFRLDTGRDHPLARAPIVGAERVANEIFARGRPFAPQARLALVNGEIGMLVGPADAPIAVAGCTISGGRIVALDLIVDQQKLAGLEIA
jgi:hypothetical protein